MKIADKREEIMQAALTIIAEQGFHAAPMAEIAEKAGVAAGTIYRYFDSKDALIMELHRKLEGEIGVKLRDGYPAERPIRERFLFLISGIIRYFIYHPLHFRYLEQYFNSPYGISLRQGRLSGESGNTDMLTTLFESGVEQQVFKELPRVVLFAFAIGPVTMLLRDHIMGLIILDETMIGKATEACWDAIKR